MKFKGATSDPDPIKKLSADQGAAIMANTNDFTKLVFAPAGSGMSFLMAQAIIESAEKSGKSPLCLDPKGDKEKENKER